MSDEQQWNLELLQEQITALELALEDADWRRLSMEGEREFSREGLRAITELSRLMYLKNPVVQRGVNVKKYYVWGQGVSVKAAQDEFNQVVQDFLDDVKNRDELTGYSARMMKEQELETDGNLFFVFFVNQVTGRVRMRSIPFAEIADIICNPDDAKEPWYYKRVWTESRMDMQTGAISTATRTAYYPDWRYTPVSKPGRIGDAPVLWDAPVYHVKVGGFSDWKFGVSEVYAAIDWARAYKEFLEDWASIVRAYRRFAFQLTTPGGKRGIAAAKARLATTLGDTGTSAEINPPPVTGSVFIANENTKLQPVRTAGATVSAEDGRRLLLMVAAGLGLPETFFGDVSVGTLATAKSLDRPTELAMRDRQTLWEDVYRAILDFVLLWALKAPQGPLRSFGAVQRQVEDGETVEMAEWNQDVDPHIDIDFPPLITRDAKEEVAAIVSAATLDGKPNAGILTERDVVRMLLTALGENDIDEIMAQMFDDQGQRIDQSMNNNQVTEAVRDLREAVRVLIAKYGGDGAG